MTESSPSCREHSTTDIVMTVNKQATTLQLVLLPAVFTEPVSFGQLLQSDTLLAMSDGGNTYQMEQSFASLRSIFVSADDVVVHVETTLVTHRTRFLSACRTIPLSLRHTLHMTSSPMSDLQIHAVQMERQRTPIAADEISSLSAHMTAIIPFIGRFLSIVLFIVIGSFRRRFF